MERETPPMAGRSHREQATAVLGPRLRQGQSSGGTRGSGRAYSTCIPLMLAIHTGLELPALVCSGLTRATPLLHLFAAE
jgi:hypothetical protein